MKTVLSQARFEGIAIPGIAAKLGASMLEGAGRPIVIDVAAVAAAAMARRAKRGAK